MTSMFTNVSIFDVNATEDRAKSILAGPVENDIYAERPRAFVGDNRTADELRARPCQVNFPYTKEEVRQFLRWEKSQKNKKAIEGKQQDKVREKKNEDKIGESSRGRK